MLRVKWAASSPHVCFTVTEREEMCTQKMGTASVNRKIVELNVNKRQHWILKGLKAEKMLLTYALRACYVFAKRAENILR